MSSIASDKVVFMVGSRYTGVCKLTRDLLYHHRDIPIGCIISPMDEIEKRFERIAPSLFIHHEYSSDILANVLKRQKAVHDPKSQACLLPALTTRDRENESGENAQPRAPSGLVASMESSA